jgi:hypothetical protein
VIYRSLPASEGGSDDKPEFICTLGVYAETDHQFVIQSLILCYIMHWFTVSCTYVISILLFIYLVSFQCFVRAFFVVDHNIIM